MSRREQEAQTKRDGYADIITRDIAEGREPSTANIRGLAYWSGWLRGYDAGEYDAHRRQEDYGDDLPVMQRRPV